MDNGPQKASSHNQTADAFDARMIKILVAVVVVVLVGALSTVILFNRKTNERRRAETASLQEAFSATLDEVNASVERFAFLKASEKLSTFDDRLSASTFIPSELQAEFDSVSTKVLLARKDYDSKIAQGWEVFEGQFVSVDQRARLRGAREKLKREQIAEQVRQQEREHDRRLEARKRADKKKSDQKVAELNRLLESWARVNSLESASVKHIIDVDVVLGGRFSTVYAAKNASDVMSNSPHFGIFFPVRYRKAGGELTEPAAGFIPVNGIPYKIGSSAKSVEA